MGGGPGRNIGAKGKTKNFWKTVKRLFRYMSKRMLSIVVLVLAIAAVVFQIQTPKKYWDRQQLKFLKAS